MWTDSPAAPHARVGNPCHVRVVVLAIVFATATLIAPARTAALPTPPRRGKPASRG
jgi:hypothetical protein